MSGELAGQPSPGITGYGRLLAAIFRPIPVRDVRGMERNRRSFTRTLTPKEADCREFTGATGLEPATSGVTGLFYRYDDWRRLTRYRSIHAGLRALGADLCTIA
jgi:hypothetical protein